MEPISAYMLYANEVKYNLYHRYGHKIDLHTLYETIRTGWKALGENKKHYYILFMEKNQE